MCHFLKDFTVFIILWQFFNEKFYYFKIEIDDYKLIKSNKIYIKIIFLHYIVLYRSQIPCREFLSHLLLFKNPGKVREKVRVNELWCHEVIKINVSMTSHVIQTTSFWKMSWSLESSENGIFLLINGLRALDLNGTAIGSIETAKPGRNATEIWVSNKYFE